MSLYVALRYKDSMSIFFHHEDGFIEHPALVTTARTKRSKVTTNDLDTINLAEVIKLSRLFINSKQTMVDRSGLIFRMDSKAFVTMWWEHTNKKLKKIQEKNIIEKQQKNKVNKLKALK